MEMIERYVAEVARNLPEKSRPDIAREIRSLLEDALEDRSQAAGRAPDEEMVVELLKEFGAPAKVAASYLPARYLVGPQLFPTFLTVLKVVLMVVGVVVLIQFGVSLTETNPDLMNLGVVFMGLLANLFGTAIQAFGVLALVFAIIQWTSPELKMLDAEWDPRKLKPVDAHEKPVKVFDLALEMVFTVAFLLAFNLYGDRLGIYIFHEDTWRFLPVFTATFFSYLPALTAVWVLTVVKDLWVLRDNRWTSLSRWFSAGLNVFSIGITLAMLAGAPIIALSPEALNVLGGLDLTGETIQAVERSLALSVRLVLVFSVIGSGVELVKTLYQLVIAGRETPLA